MAISRSTARSASRSTWSNASWHISLWDAIWQPSSGFFKKRWQFHIAISDIIRLVKSQLALYSHVRCSPSTAPDAPETPLKHPQNTPT